MRILFATLALLSSLAACARPEAADKPSAAPARETDAPSYPREEGVQPRTIDDLRAQSLAAIDADACAAQGGEVRQEGMLGTYRCTVPYADAGTACSDKSDCEGRCLLPPGSDAAHGEAATGACQANDSPFGCYAEILGGRVAAAVCVD